MMDIRLQRPHHVWDEAIVVVFLTRHLSESRQKNQAPCHWGFATAQSMPRLSSFVVCGKLYEKPIVEWVFQTKVAGKHLFHSCRTNSEVSWKHVPTGERIIMEKQVKELGQISRARPAREMSSQIVPLDSKWATKYWIQSSDSASLPRVANNSRCIWRGAFHAAGGIWARTFAVFLFSFKAVRSDDRVRYFQRRFSSPSEEERNSESVTYKS
jgi:hypothetical protein